MNRGFLSDDEIRSLRESATAEGVSGHPELSVWCPRGLFLMLLDAAEDRNRRAAEPNETEGA